ncbi:hypothetical protein [Paenibacillus pinistramenti]|uniref:hypothetical protein n=1 Tax=Paenibacillus pinistramenti TaxID=1768003 RepID=UPI001108CB07|nr:hypothetical protein [Paenibacillus pinistramenti]
MQEKRNIQTKISVNAKNDANAAQQQPVNKGDASNNNAASSGKKTKNTFLQGCLGCFGVLVLIGIVAVVAVAMFGDKNTSDGLDPALNCDDRNR